MKRDKQQPNGNEKNIDDLSYNVAYSYFRVPAKSGHCVRSICEEVVNIRPLWRFPLNRVAGSGGLLPENHYVDYRPDSRLMPTDCDDEFTNVSFLNLPREDLSEVSGWTSSCRIEPKRIKFAGSAECDYIEVCIGTDLVLSKMDFQAFASVLMNTAFAQEARSGFVFQQSRWNGPFFFTSGLSYRDSRDNPQPRQGYPKDYGLTYGGGGDDWGGDTMIRNVFPFNFLPDKVMDMPYGMSGTTVGDFLKRHSGTKKLKRFNAFCWRWEPHWEAIEILREELFRGGRLWYYDFVQRPFDKWYREDLQDPWYYDGELPASIQPGWSDLWAKGITP